MRIKAVAIRKKAELTQRALADKAGVSLPSINRLEAGMTVSVPVLHRVAVALNTTMDELLQEDSDEPLPDDPAGG